MMKHQQKLDRMYGLPSFSYMINISVDLLISQLST